MEAKGIKIAARHGLDIDNNIAGNWDRHDKAKKQALKGLDVALCSEHPMEDCTIYVKVALEFGL